MKTYMARHQWLMPIVLATQEAKIRRIMIQSHPWQRDPISNIKRAGGVARVIELLPSKCEALSSNHSTRKKKNKCLWGIHVCDVFMHVYIV
jgi:hypothetical protein